jgi:site-specific recombinase XerD
MIYFRKGKYVVDTTWLDGLRTRFRRPSKDKAEELEKRIYLAVVDNTWESLRANLKTPMKNDHLIGGLFSDIADEYYDQWVVPRNRSTASKKSFLNRFKARFSRYQIGVIHLQHIDSYIASRRKAGVVNASINRELSCLRHLFKWAIDREIIHRNPLARLKKLKEEEWAGPEPTEEVIQAVFEKLQPRILPLFIVIRETGARLGEVLDLEHWQIDREHRVVRFKHTKTDKVTTAPLTNRAIEAIDSVLVLPGCSFVFYNPETRTRWFDIRKLWDSARTEAGYPWLRIRDLRPAFGREAARYGTPMHWIQSALGHQSVKTTEKYYAKFRPEAAAAGLLQCLEDGRKAGTSLPGSALAQPLAQGGKN